MGKFVIAWLLSNSVGSLVYSLIFNYELSLSPAFTVRWEDYLYFFLLFELTSLILTFLPMRVLLLFMKLFKQRWSKIIYVNLVTLIYAVFGCLIAIFLVGSLLYAAIVLTLSYAIPYFLVFNFAMWVALPAQLKK